MFDVVCVGSATQDVFIKSDLSKIVRISDALTQKELLCYDYGSKVTVDNIEFLTGGGATNTAVSFARLGLKAAFLGKVGKDDAANSVLGELSKEGVDAVYAISSNSRATGYSVVLISFEGDRTVLTFRGANDSLDENDVDWQLFDNTKWIYMSSLSGRSAQIAETLARRAKERNVKLAFNPGSTQLKTRIKGLGPIFQCTDVLIMNREEAEMVAGVTATRKGVDQERCALCGDCVNACEHGVLKIADSRLSVQGAELCSQCGKCVSACPRGAMVLEPWAYNLFEIFRIFMESGVKVAVITDGRLGSQACDGKNVYVFPAYAAPTVDTLGAGDAFASAFVAEYMKTGDVCKALQMGAANSSSVVRYFGAKPGLLTLAEAESFIAEKAGQDIYFVRTLPFSQLVAR